MRRDARGQPRMLTARWQPMFAPCREMNKRCCAVVFLALPLSLSAVRCLFINVAAFFSARIMRCDEKTLGRP